MDVEFDPKPTTRFSNRVENYIRFRPGYPDAVLDCLRRELGLTPAWVIADVGSGTGILTEKFLKNGNCVFAVEPNDEMRMAAEKTLGCCYPELRSIKGTAEATSLQSDSVDLVVAGQAFHWFDAPHARVEFSRILKSEGWIALMWNTRQTNSSAFLMEYETLLRRFSADYSQVDHRNVTAVSLGGFFSEFQKRTFSNSQDFDFEGLTGRLLSSSYAPMPGNDNYEPMMNDLARIFRAHQVNGEVRFLYETELYFGKILPR